MITPSHPTAVTKPLAHVREARRWLGEQRRPLTDHWQAVADLCDELLERLDAHWQPDQRSHVTRLERLWDDCLADIPQPGSGWDGGRSGGHSDPVATGVIGRGDGAGKNEPKLPRTDPGTTDRALIVRLSARIHARARASTTDHSTHLARQAHDDADHLARLISRRTPRQPLASQRRATEAAGLPGCAAHQQAGTWTPVAHTWRKGTDAAVELCSACYRRATTTGTVPTAQDVDRFDRTARWPAIHDKARKAS